MLRCGQVTWKVPANWYGQVRRGSGGLATFGIATSPLPAETDAVGEVASTKMHTDDIRILLVVYGAGDAAAGVTGGRPAFPPKVEDMTVYHVFEHMPRGHSMARKPFELQGRLFDLQVEFGGAIDSHQARRADDVLGQLRVTPSKNSAADSRP